MAARSWRCLRERGSGRAVAPAPAAAGLGSRRPPDRARPARTRRPDRGSLDVDHRAAGGQPRREDLVAVPGSRAARSCDDLAPDRALQRVDDRAGSPASSTRPPSMIAIRLHSSRTSSTMWVERITTTFCADLAEQVVEAVALLRVEAGGRLVDDEELGLAEQRLRDAEALAHAARDSCPACFLRDVLEVGLTQQRRRRASRRSCRSVIALEQRRSGRASPRPRCAG